LGVELGGRVSSAAGRAGAITGQGIVNAAATMAPSNAFSPSGEALSTFGQSPEFRSAINRIFGT
jgi:hypothetical protein